jgi:hypothetical protein
MPRKNIPQTSFAGGKFSPIALSRTDTNKYPIGAKDIENFRVMLQGPLTRRTGSKFIREVKDSTKDTNLVPFIYSNSNSYGLEFGDQYFRIIKDFGYINSVGSTLVTNGDFPSNITGWTDSSTGTGSIAWNAGGFMDITSVDADNKGIAEQAVSGLTEGVQYQFSITVSTGAIEFYLGTTSLGNQILYEPNLGVGTHTINFYAPATTVYISVTHATGATHGVDDITIKPLTPLEVVTPWTEAQLPDISWTQSESTLYVFHKNVKPRKIVRTSDTNWTVSEWAKSDGPFLPTNKTATTLTPAASTGTNVNVTASTAIFKASDVGRLLRMVLGGVYGVCEIITYNSATSVQVDIDTINDAYGPNISTVLGTPGATSVWRWGAWGDDEGYPEHGFTYQGRMVLGNNINGVNHMWFSESDDFESFQPTSNTGAVASSNAFSVQLNSDEVNAINWISSTKTLVVGTTGSIWSVFSGDTTNTLSPTNRESVRVSPNNTYKSPPVVAGKGLFFLSSTREKVRNLLFDFSTDSFDTPDMTTLAEDSGSDLFSRIDFEEEPIPTLWGYTANGQLWNASVDASEDVIAWAKQVIGGTDVVIKSLIVLPTSNGQKYNVHLIVARTIDGVTKQYVEYITDKFFPSSDTDTSIAYFVDGGGTYDGDPTTEIRGFYHLRGQTVQVLANGGTHEDVTVTAQGGLTLTRSTSVAQVGYHADAKVTMLPLPDVIDVKGSTYFSVKRLISATIRFFKSIGGKVTGDGTSFEDIQTGPGIMDASPPLFTGTVKVAVKGENEDDNTTSEITLIQDKPLPMTVLGISREVEIDNG